jgi:hypothetical protein
MNDEELQLRLRTLSLMGGSSRAAIRTTWSMSAARAETAACYTRDGRTDIDVCGGIYFSSFHRWHCADSVI